MSNHAFNEMFNRLLRKQERERVVITDEDQRPLNRKVNMKKRTKHGSNEAQPVVDWRNGRKARTRKSRYVRFSNGIVR